MEQVAITLKNIDTKVFFGVQNQHFKALQDYFPKLKIVGRGHLIKAFGEATTLNIFEQKIEQIVRHVEVKQQLSKIALQRLLLGNHHDETPNSVLFYGVKGKKIKAKTKNQETLVTESMKNDLVFAVGPAGTGKTYTAVALAVNALKKKIVSRIILTRPAVESGEQLGFLPGDLKEKLDPYMQPLYDSLSDMIAHDKLKEYIEQKTIEIAPLAFMRGRTLDDAYVILDEAQNATQEQIKMFLTRMGKNARFIITGDPGQVDLPQKQKSGLTHAMQLLKDIKGVAQVKLDETDVVRHCLVADIVKAYEDKTES